MHKHSPEISQFENKIDNSKPLMMRKLSRIPRVVKVTTRKIKSKQKKKNDPK